MTLSERITALQKFGYDHAEARFLCTAALQSGYFLRRQFLAFAGAARGTKDVVLLNKLEARAHGRAHVYRHERKVYHLCAKPLYDALGEPDSRNRRAHQPSTIKNKIMGLDFVLGHPDYEFLLTEREKAGYFEARGIVTSALPMRLYRSRHRSEPAVKKFPEPYPIFVLGAGGRPTPHFCYIDEGLQTTDRFATFLRGYARLFESIGDFQVIYVAEEPRLFASAERTFRRFVRAFESNANGPVPDAERLKTYFLTRRAYENRDFSGFDTASLIRFREEKRYFSSEHYDALYARWIAGDSTILATPHHHKDTASASLERFSTHLLRYDYDLFGNLTGEVSQRRTGNVPTEL